MKQVGRTEEDLEEIHLEEIEAETETEEEKLTKEKLTEEDIEFVFETMKKEAKHDELSIKQLFYGMMSTFTRLPMPHVTNSKDPGAGKSYLLNLVASHIPDKYITPLAGTSEKTLFHKDGIMVYEDENHEIKPIQPVLTELRLKIDLEDEIQEQNKK